MKDQTEFLGLLAEKRLKLMAGFLGSKFEKSFNLCLGSCHIFCFKFNKLVYIMSFNDDNDDD